MSDDKVYLWTACCNLTSSISKPILMQNWQLIRSWIKLLPVSVYQSRARQSLLYHAYSLYVCMLNIAKYKHPSIIGEPRMNCNIFIMCHIQYCHTAVHYIVLKVCFHIYLYHRYGAENRDFLELIGWQNYVLYIYGAQVLIVNPESLEGVECARAKCANMRGEGGQKYFILWALLKTSHKRLSFLFFSYL